MHINALFGEEVKLGASKETRMWWSDWFDHGFMAWMFFGPLMMIIFVAACVSIGYLVVRAVRPSRAIDILRERFARGEIDEAEFENRRRIILS